MNSNITNFFQVRVQVRVQKFLFFEFEFEFGQNCRVLRVRVRVRVRSPAVSFSSFTVTVEKFIRTENNNNIDFKNYRKKAFVTMYNRKEALPPVPVKVSLFFPHLTRKVKRSIARMAKLRLVSRMWLFGPLLVAL